MIERNSHLRRRQRHDIAFHDYRLEARTRRNDAAKCIGFVDGNNLLGFSAPLTTQNSIRFES